MSPVPELEFPRPEMALPNLFFISSRDSHPDINLLNNDRGVSHNNTSVPNMVHTVIHAFCQKFSFLLVKNLYNQKIQTQTQASTHRFFHVSLCQGVKLLQLLNALSKIPDIHHCLKVSHQSIFS
jgi:hypothetical protein